MKLITDKGCYLPDEPITLTLFADPDEPLGNGLLTVSHLQHTVYTQAFTACAGENHLTLPPLGKAGMGLGVEASVWDANGTAVYSQTAVPIGDGVVRYGFLSDFLPEDADDVRCMAAWHVSHVQFYDWSYRHDTLVSPTEAFCDMMGKQNCLSAIRAKIEACHERGMHTMAYGAIYAASKTFRDAHADWGLYAAPEQPLSFINTFFFMDVDSPWRKHLFAQYQAAMERLGFDGVHMDTYGYPKRALGADGHERNLETALSALIADADASLRTAGLKPQLILNNVGTWPVQATRNAPQAAVYMELWPPYDRLRHLRQAVALAKEADKPVVLAAYLAPFRTEAEAPALYGALITSFAIALCGATQLFLGEKDAVLTQGYYADYTQLTPWQAERLHAYQDFFVRYQELLIDRTLRDVSMTHSGWDNMEYRCDTPFSTEAAPDKLWLTFLENDSRRVVGLVNLCGNTDDAWNRGKNPPRPLEGIVLRILLVKPVDCAWYASPDEPLGSARLLPCECRQTERGIEAAIVLPRLFVSGLLWLDTAAQQEE